MPKENKYPSISLARCVEVLRIVNFKSHNNEFNFIQFIKLANKEFKISKESESCLKSLVIYKLINTKNGYDYNITELGKSICESESLSERNEKMKIAFINCEPISKLLDGIINHEVVQKNGLIKMIRSLFGDISETQRFAQIFIDDGLALGILKETNKLIFVTKESESHKKNVEKSLLKFNNDNRFKKIESVKDPSFLHKDKIVDSYKLIERLGSGFSSEVWLAKVMSPPPNVKLKENQNVAIKFYNQQLLSAPDSVLRIEREYKVASKLNHPNLVKIYEFMLSSTRPHHNFLVMEYLEGVPLQNYVKKSKLTGNQILSVVHQLGSALQALHEISAYHRDIKPNNISITLNDQKLKCTLLDLGIVSIDSEKSITINSRFLGSRHWAPFEQLLGEFHGIKSDLYSFASVIYSLVENQEPYESCKTEASVVIQMDKTPIQISDGKLPSEITKFLNNCLSKEYQNRPESINSLLDILE